MSFGMLLHYWNGLFDSIEGFLCSRKFNGWSALWDGGITTGILATEIPWYYQGKDKGVISTGLWSLGRDVNNEIRPKVINAPSYFIKQLPKLIPIHGELWYNDRLDIIKKTCGRKNSFSGMWYNIKFIAFHIKPYSLWEGIDKFISKNESKLTFQESIYSLYKFNNKVFNVINPIPILNIETLKNIQKLSIEKQWEGLVFAKPNGFYECKRSYNVLKWKSEYETEAAVYGYENGKTGKNIGKIGSIKATLIWDDKILSIFGGNKSMINQEANFCVSGLTDYERSNVYTMYPIGSIIKFKFNGVSIHGIPQSCNIYRKG